MEEFILGVSFGVSVVGESFGVPLVGASFVGAFVAAGNGGVVVDNSTSVGATVGIPVGVFDGAELGKRVRS